MCKVASQARNEAQRMIALEAMCKENVPRKVMNKRISSPFSPSCYESWQMSARIHVWWTIFKQWISYTYIEENIIINLLIWKINTYVLKQLSRAPKDFFSVNNGRTRKAKHFLITIPFVKGIRRFPNLCTIFGGCVSHISLPRLIPIIVKKIASKSRYYAKRPLESSNEITRAGYSMSSNFPLDSSGLGRAEKATLNVRDDQSFLKTSEQINRF